MNGLDIEYRETVYKLQHFYSMEQNYIKCRYLFYILIARAIGMVKLQRRCSGRSSGILGDTSILSCIVRGKKGGARAP